MPNKSVVVTIIAAALLIGAATSGCKRNRENRNSAQNRRNPAPSRSQDLAARPVRPAEVLSVSVHRSNQRRESSVAAATPYNRPTARYPAYPHANAYSQHPQTTYAMAQVYEPLPEPIPLPVATAYGDRQPHAIVRQPYAHELVSAPATPELAVAQTMLEPLPAPAVYIPQQPQQHPLPAQFYNNAERHAAPLPELEPVRYCPVVEPPPSVPRPVPIMMSTAPARHDSRDRREVQKALAPLPQTPSLSQAWVASPATAMRSSRHY